MIRKFIKDIVEEKNGFSFDQPHRLGEESLSVLVPVVRNTNKKRDYITFAEAKNIKITDIGMINLVNVENNEDMPLYVSRGSIFKGATQERAAIHGYIIEPNSNLNIAVRCIHHTKSIQNNTDMTYGGITPYIIDLSSQFKTWNSISNFQLVSGSSISTWVSSYEQYPVIINTLNTIADNWATVTTTSGDGDNYLGTFPTNEMNDLRYETTNVKNDDLVGILETMGGNLKDAMKNIPYIEKQVGGVFLQGSGKIIGLDIYDIPKSWQSIKNDMIKKEGASFIDDEDDLFIMRPEKSVKIISKKLSQEFSEKIIYSKNYSVVEVKYKDLIGEAVIFNNTVIHLTLWSK